MEVKIYTARREEGLWKLTKEIARGFVDGRELAWRLFLRDKKADYKASLLGFFWVFIPPFATAGLWMFLRTQRVVAIQETPMKYIAFTLCGTLLWSLFAEAINKPLVRYKSAMGMMVKLNFPREAIILAAFYDLAFTFFIKLMILIPSLWVMGYPPSLYFIPALLSGLGLVFCGLAIGLFLCPLGLLYTDIGKLITFGLPFVMYLTPVIYPLRTSGPLLTIQWLNPVTPFLERTRSWLGGYEFMLQQELMIWSMVLMVLFMAGLLALKIALPVIVERSGS